jgi:hypothetical protein
MDQPQELPPPESSLSALIHDLKNHRERVAGSRGESPASLLAYVEALERRIARLENNERAVPEH